MATIYHVGTTGRHANDGSRASPFATIQRIGNALMPSDIVYYPPGTYQNEAFEDGVFDGGGISKNSSDTIIKLNGVRGTDDQLTII